ncbi:MAG: hypothetical protein N2201_04540 [candidate division WOR-3 bacterium]|nr:hypothetical protein [candidate division WOR-3 bacterium]
MPKTHATRICVGKTAEKYSASSIYPIVKIDFFVFFHQLLIDIMANFANSFSHPYYLLVIIIYFIYFYLYN